METNIYEVLHLLQNEDNVDKLNEIFERWYFNTSVRTPEWSVAIVEGLKDIASLGELKIYQFIKESSGVKL